MFAGLLWVIATGLTWASISAVMSNVARCRVPTFLFYSIGATLTAILGWILLVDWQAAARLPLRELLIAAPLFMLPGLVNVASQTVMVQSLKLGHNGLSIAIRNCAGIVPFTVGLLFLNATVRWFNWIGLLLITVGLILIALSKKSSGNRTSKTVFTLKWLIAAAGSMLLSGTFQTLNMLSTVKFNTIVKIGMATPLVMTCCALGYIAAFLIWQRKSLAGGSFTGAVWRYAGVWAVLALLSYYFMFAAIDAMRAANATALVFPTVMGINISCFSVYSKIKLHEKYTALNIGCLVLCLLGVILLNLR